MQQLSHTTSIVSWSLILSAIRRAREGEQQVTPIDLNLETPSCVILCCTALEAFANEISSLTYAFLANREKGPVGRRNLIIVEQNGTRVANLEDQFQEIAQIREDSSGSFYDRYKRLLKSASLEPPNWMPQLADLNHLRKALVHFRACDMLVVNNSDGFLRCFQQPPEVFNHLKSYKVDERWSVVAEDGAEWVLKVSTNAAAIWSLDLILDAAIYVLSNLPAGECQEFILQRYSARDADNTVFEVGKSAVEEWKQVLLSTTS